MVLGVVAAVGVLPAQSLVSITEEDGDDGFWWQQRSHLRQGVVAVASLSDSDSLTGVALGYGIRFTGDDVPGCGTVWLSRQMRDSERAMSLRGDMAMWLFARD